MESKLHSGFESSTSEKFAPLAARELPAASVDVSGVTVTYNNGHTAISDTSFRLEGGTICALVGINGSGKSTLFKSIMGFLRPTRGKVTISGMPVRAAQKHNLIAYVPQSEEVDWNFPVSVWDVVMMGRFGYMNFLRMSSREDRRVAEESLRRVSMWDYRERQIGELSGGQKKRVFLARALAQQGRVILLDEPFTGVDVKTESEIIELLRELRTQGHIVLVSTHNLGSVPEFCDQVVLINKTVLAFGATADVFTEENLSRAFGGVLRHFRFDHTDLPHEEGQNKLLVISDDERPLLLGRDGHLRTGETDIIKKGIDNMESLFTELAIPFKYAYMWNAMYVSALIGGVCGLLSCFITLKGWSLMGDALSHSVVPGVALASYVGMPFALGAFVAGLLAAVVMAFVKTQTRIREDAVIGIVYTAFFAFGALLTSMYPSGIALKTIAFGNILGIAPEDIRQVCIISGVTTAVLLLKWKDLVLYCFDPQQARALGLRVTLLHYTLLTLLAATAVAAIQTVGACLVVGTLVAPGATAYLLTDRFGRMLWISCGLGVATGFIGGYASYFLDGSAGGCIVSLQSLIFIAALIFAPKHGLIASRRKGSSRTAEVTA